MRDVLLYVTRVRFFPPHDEFLRPEEETGFRHLIASKFPMDPKRKLKGMLARIFSDAVAEESEREELKAYLASGVLSVAEIKEVFEDFVQTTWKITVADGVVSDREKQRLREIVQVLVLDESVLPKEWAAIVER